MFRRRRKKIGRNYAEECQKKTWGIKRENAMMRSKVDSVFFPLKICFWEKNKKKRHPRVQRKFLSPITGDENFQIFPLHVELRKLYKKQSEF